LKKMVSVLALAILFFVAVPAQAQVTSNQASVNLSMTISESITVSASPANISFTYSPSGGGTATASGPITVVTSANLAAGHNRLDVYGWLSSASAALSGPSNITSAQVFANTTGVGGTVGTGAGPVPCTGLVAEGFGTSGTECGSIVGPDDFLDSLRNTPGLAAGGQFVITDTVTLSLANLGALLPGSYSGVINFQSMCI